MKIAFISDIHGNAVALEAVLNDIEKKDVDKIYVLGDLCFRGLEPKQSLKLIRELNTKVIKGNADEWVVRSIKEGEVPNHALKMMNKERDWTVSQLDEDSLEYLRKLPFELNLEFGQIKIQAFHATPSSLFETVLPTESEEVISEKIMKDDADIYIYAHIHKPFIRYMKGKCIMNTGSVGLPFDEVSKASYALINIEKNNFETSIVRVNYDIRKVIDQFDNSDYPNSYQLKKILGKSFKIS